MRTKLTEAEYQHIQDKLNLPVFKDVLYSTRVMLLDSSVNIYTLVTRLYAALKSRDNHLGLCRKKWILALSQLVGRLLLQNDDFFSHAIISSNAMYLKGDLSSNINVNIFLMAQFKQSLKLLYMTSSLPKNLRINVSKNNANLFLEMSGHISEQKAAYSRYRAIAFFGMIYTLCLGFSDYTQQGTLDTPFQYRNIALFMLAFTLYNWLGSYSVRVTAGAINHRKKMIYRSPSTPTLELIHLKSSPEDKECGLALHYNYDPEVTVAAPSVTTDIDDKPSVIGAKQRVRRRQFVRSTEEKRFSIPPQPANITIPWRQDCVWFHELQAPILSPRDTQVLDMPYPNRGVKYYTFFNRVALEQQGVVSGTDERRDYSRRLERSRLVPDNGFSGIKAVRPKVQYERIKIGSHVFENVLCSFKAKTVGTKYRLFGQVVDTKLDREGMRHKLISFDYHVDNGPGHK